MVKRKMTELNNPKRQKFIDIEFDTEEESDEDPEWLPEDSSSESDS